MVRNTHPHPELDGVLRLARRHVEAQLVERVPADVDGAAARFLSATTWPHEPLGAWVIPAEGVPDLERRLQRAGVRIGEEVGGLAELLHAGLAGSGGHLCVAFDIALRLQQRGDGSGFSASLALYLVEASGGRGIAAALSQAICSEHFNAAGEGALATLAGMTAIERVGRAPLPPGSELLVPVAWQRAGAWLAEVGELIRARACCLHSVALFRSARQPGGATRSRLMAIRCLLALSDWEVGLREGEHLLEELRAWVAGTGKVGRDGNSSESPELLTECLQLLADLHASTARAPTLLAVTLMGHSSAAALRRFDGVVAPEDQRASARSLLRAALAEQRDADHGRIAVGRTDDGIAAIEVDGIPWLERMLEAIAVAEEHGLERRWHRLQKTLLERLSELSDPTIQEYCRAEAARRARELDFEPAERTGAAPQG